MKLNRVAKLVFYLFIGYSRWLWCVLTHKQSANLGDRAMVENLGINILVPIIVFGFLIVGAYMMSDTAFKDVLSRRKK